MLKQLSMCAALLAFAAGYANAQQQEAVLRKVEVPGAGFDIVVATPKSPGTIMYDLSDSPDALIVHLAGGKLALAFDGAEKMLQVLESLRRPIGAFEMERLDGRSRISVALYLVPAGE